MQSTFTLVTPRRSSKGLFKLVVAGTVALTAAVIASVYLYQSEPKSNFAFYQDMGEKETAFLNFLARYGKTYASKTDLTGRFEVFSKNYDAVQAHNAVSERFSMGIN